MPIGDVAAHYSCSAPVVEDGLCRHLRRGAIAVPLATPALPAPPADPPVALLPVASGWTLPEPGSPAFEVGAGMPDPTAAAAFGPAAPQTTVTVGAERRYSFGEHLNAVRWETLGLAAYLTAINLPGLVKHPSGFDFEEEGLFGKDTANLGVDKVAHAYNAYVISDVLYARMKRRTGATPSSALASSAIALGLDVYAELFDAFEDRSGFSVSDVGFNVLGTGFSYLRNSVPGLKEKLDFRLLLIPNRDLYSIDNKKEHFRQERFLFALKLAGFSGLENGPLRFVELHAGYYARGFTDRERARGDERQRKLFVGVGINLKELLFPNARSTVARVARTGLDYLQVPYTAVHID